VLGEDVQDQLCPVDDARRQRVLQAALLGRAQLVVDQERLGASLRVLCLKLLQLPLPHVAALVRPRTALDELTDRLDAGRAGKLPQLCELVFLVDATRQHGDDESPLGLRPRSGLPLALHD
jgi:hypothetical protein